MIVPGFKFAATAAGIKKPGDVLTIRADIEEEEERREESYYMHEQRRGHFERSVLLPNPVIADRAEAEFENGILTLRLPKSSEATTRKIKIRKK